MKPPVPAERHVLKATMDFLALRGFRVWRQNVGMMILEHKGIRRAVRAGIKGQADITGYHKGTGRRLEVEVKREGKEPSQVQAQWLQQCAEEGVIAFWCDSVPGCDAELRRYGY